MKDRRESTELRKKKQFIDQNFIQKKNKYFKKQIFEIRQIKIATHHDILLHFILLKSLKLN